MAGEVLKVKREELGLDIKEVADRLKIKAEYLSSIEDDRFEKLPVAVYTTGYIRCYASFLKVDADPILAIYAGHLSHPQPSAIIPIASSMKKVPFYMYVIPVLVLVLAGLLIFIFLRRGSDDLSGRIGVSPLQPVSPAPVAAPPVIPTPVPAASPEPALPAVPSLPQQVAAGQHRMSAAAVEKTWMRITRDDGRSDETLVRPGMTQEWTFQGQALLRLGNAGGIRLEIDGRLIGIPGKSGQVMTIQLPAGQPVPDGSDTPKE